MTQWLTCSWVSLPLGALQNNWQTGWYMSCSVCLVYRLWCYLQSSDEHRVDSHAGGDTCKLLHTLPTCCVPPDTPVTLCTPWYPHYLCTMCVKAGNLRLLFTTHVRSTRKVMFRHLSVCLSLSTGGVPQPGSSPRHWGTPILPVGGTPSFPTGGTPILPARGTPFFLIGGYPILLGVPHPRLDGVPPIGTGWGYPHRDWMKVPPLQSRLDVGTPPPQQEWMALGQVMLRAVHLLRFPAGGPPCFI